MTGKAGRSGKARTPEERQAKRRFAQMGGNAAAGRDPTPPTDDDGGDRPDGSVQHSPALLAAFPELSGYPFPVLDSLALKDALEAALKQAKAKQAEVELDEACVKRDKERGKLLTAADHREAIQGLASMLIANLSILVDAALTLVPPEQQPGARLTMDHAVTAFRKQAAEAARGKG